MAAATSERRGPEVLQQPREHPEESKLANCIVSIWLYFILSIWREIIADDLDASEMVQVFMVVRCYSCKTFQVQQVRQTAC